MVAQRHISPTELDTYLSTGYFRMTDQLFTTDYIPYDDKLYQVHWLRFVINRVQYSKEAKRLFRINQNFTSETLPFTIDLEVLDLYDKFRLSRKLYLETPLQENFCGQSGVNPLDTRMIRVRDGNRLIACGFFDEGERSMAGILNIYDPDYEKYSPGKWLILLKMEYARKNHFQFYYPGYIISGLDRFDYKLFPCKHSPEIYDAETGEWAAFTKKPQVEPILISDALTEEFLRVGEGEDATVDRVDS